ncbi:MAG TPA: hypothetical protein ENJ56_01780 [Anaerolineae bacterium]|nr:hypothetical protein [Anaerolineae bacterium]
MGLQQNCTHALQNWGGNLQFLLAKEGAMGDAKHQSNCGNTITLIDPQLSPLSHGVLPLQWNSPAIDAAVGRCPATDQRGVARPQGKACDIGAYEFKPWNAEK